MAHEKKILENAKLRENLEQNLKVRLNLLRLLRLTLVRLIKFG